jgi:enoyl-CoA hydratase/carnithine racemase
VTPRDLTDWACEMVNQSVGRLRNRLLAYGVSVALSVPQSALAERLRLSSSLRPTPTPISFAIDGMVLDGWLELEIGAGFRLAESPSDEEGAALREGSIVLF